VRIEVDAASLSPQVLRGEDDLAGVVAHVLDRVEERAEAVGLPPLDLPGRRERGLVKGQDDRAAPAHDGGQAPAQLGPTHRSVGGELEVPPARVRLAAEAAEHPLREVAAEVEDEVAHAVAAGSGPPPDLALVEPLQARADLAEVLLEVVRGETRQPVGHRHLPRPYRLRTAATRSIGIASAVSPLPLTVVARRIEL
jgi:hypothetical protein